MNERILELYKQARQIPGNEGAVDDPYMADHELRFAELIVRECAKALDEKLANPNGASMAYCDGSDLLEYFGVE